MLNYFNQVAVRFMKDHYGSNFIINYNRSDDRRICFDQTDQTGKRFLRKYLTLPNWLCSVNTVEVVKQTGQEISVFDDATIHDKDKAAQLI